MSPFLFKSCLLASVLYCQLLCHWFGNELNWMRDPPDHHSIANSWLEHFMLDISRLIIWKTAVLKVDKQGKIVPAPWWEEAYQGRQKWFSCYWQVISHRQSFLRYVAENQTMMTLSATVFSNWELFFWLFKWWCSNVLFWVFVFYCVFGLVCEFCW